MSNEIKSNLKYIDKITLKKEIFITMAIIIHRYNNEMNFNIY